MGCSRESRADREENGEENKERFLPASSHSRSVGPKPPGFRRGSFRVFLLWDDEALGGVWHGFFGPALRRLPTPYHLKSTLSGLNNPGCEDGAGRTPAARGHTGTGVLGTAHSFTHNLANEKLQKKHIQFKFNTVQ